jgi:hypothetical protein
MPHSYETLKAMLKDQYGKKKKKKKKKKDDLKEEVMDYPVPGPGSY